MNWVHKLQRKFRFGIDNLMIYITVTMLAIYLVDNFVGLGLSNWLYFSRARIFSGQIWRLLTFIFLPPDSSPIFVLISLYFYYFIGSTLERSWGANYFTLYYLFGIVGNIVAGLITGTATNMYLNFSLFFAFAQLFPDQQVLLFFVIPIKIKYLAYVNWAFFGLSFLGYLFQLNLAGCLAIIASLLNFFLFFGDDFINRFRNWRKYGKQRRDFRRQNDDNNFWRRSLL